MRKPQDRACRAREVDLEAWACVQEKSRDLGVLTGLNRIVWPWPASQKPEMQQLDHLKMVKHLKPLE